MPDRRLHRDRLCARRRREPRTLGLRGEEGVDDEKRVDLSQRVRWSSRDEGDGLGYDISSFDRDGAARLIEVKNTGLGKYFPFAVTANELAVPTGCPTVTGCTASSTSD